MSMFLYHTLSCGPAEQAFNEVSVPPTRSVAVGRASHDRVCVFRCGEDLQ